MKIHRSKTEPSIATRCCLALVFSLGLADYASETQAGPVEADDEPGDASESQPSSNPGDAGSGTPRPSSEDPVAPSDTLTEPASPPVTHSPKAGQCGLEQPAFCDGFEQGPVGGGRAGELDGAFWSGLRAMPTNHPDFLTAFSVTPSFVGNCRDDLHDTMVSAEFDALICDPVDPIGSRHLLVVSAAQNYGLSAYRIRQPFDFDGREGRIVMDVDLSANGLGGWPAIVLSRDPTPAPSFNFPERGSGPRHGVSVEFYLGWCNTPGTGQALVYRFDNYSETTPVIDFDCGLPHFTTQKGALNHVELVIASDRIEVWASDASVDGETFPNFQRLVQGPLALPFTRGYVSLVVRNHATIKYGHGSDWPVRWDNVGFDGPVIDDWAEFSAPDALDPVPTSDGCDVDGECLWRGEAVARRPDDDSVCETPCDFEIQALNTGYVLPREDETPSQIRIEIPDVDLGGATAARLALAVHYPWFEWNDVFPPPTELMLRYRMNGNAWHERPITPDEVNAFEGAPDEGPGAGLLNQLIELDLAELENGANVLELGTSGTWTGSYRAAAVGIDVILSR